MKKHVLPIGHITKKEQSRLVRAIAALIIVLLALVKTTSGQTTLYASDFGAIPGDSIDDTLALQAALDACLPGSTLELDGGSYVLFSSTAPWNGLHLSGIIALQ